MSVPALAKNFRKSIESNIRQKGPAAEKLFNHALKIAYKYNGYGWDRGKGARAIYKPLLNLYDKILFSKIREGFGGKLQLFIGGGALLVIADLLTRVLVSGAELPIGMLTSLVGGPFFFWLLYRQRRRSGGWA